MPRESTIQVYRSTTTDIPTGLTFGEIAYSDLNGKLFVGDNSGASRWVGAEVTSGTLSTNSQYLVPTQSAVKTYVDGVVGGGSVVNSINGAGGSITITGDTQSSRVSVSGTTTTITNRLATASATGVASFDPNFFTVGSTGHVRFTGATGETIQQGSKVAITKSGNVTTINLDIPIASTSATGAAYFDSGAFTVDPDGKVKLASTVSFTIRDEIMQTDTISIGDTLTITGGRGIDVYKVGTDTLAVQGATATTTGLGVASFSSTNFDVAAGAVSIKSGGVPNAALVNSSVTVSPGTGLGGGGAVALGSSVTLSNTGVLSSNGATGAVTITGDAGSQQVSVSGTTTTITNRLATVSATGVASFATANFDVAAGAVSIKNAGVPNTALANSSVTVSPGTGLGGGGAVALGSSVTLSNTGVLSSNGATGAVTITGDSGSQQVSVSGTTTTITNRLATVSATGVASFATANFDVAAGAVSIKNAGVPNTALANSSVIVSAGSNNTISLGGTLTITGTANQVSVSSNGSGTVTLGLPNDITIPGNLTVNGTVVTANVDTFAVKDPLITLGTGNAADSLDLGFYGRYVSSGTRFAGLFRDASDSGKFKLFAGLTAEPTTIVDNAQSSFAIATLIAKVDGGTF